MKYLIELVADAKGLEPGVDALEQIGQIDKANSAQFKKTNEDIKKYSSSLDGVSKAMKETSKAATGAFGGAAIKDATKAATSFRTQMRQSREEVTKLFVEGKATTAEIYKMAKGGGALKDAMMDAQQAISVLASDTFKLDAALQGVQLGAAGFQAIQAGAALFGKESEDLQKTLVLLNATMAGTQAIQQIVNLTQKQSALSLGVNIAAQKLYTFVVGGSTGALRGFKLALAATGIGLAIIAIGELVANWDKLKVSIFGATQALDDYKESLDKVKEQSDKNLDALKTELKIRRLLGDITEEEAMKQTIAYKKVLEADLVGRLLKQKEKVDELKKTYGEYYEEQKTNGNKDIKREEAKFDAINTLYRKSLGERLDSEKELKDFQDKAAQDEADRLKKQQEEKQKFIEKYLAEKLRKEKEAIQQEIALQEIVLLELQDNARERLKVEENLIYLKGELAKKDAKSAIEKSLIEARVISDTEALRKKFRENELSQIKLRQDRTLEAESKILDAELERERKRREAHRERLKELDEYRAAEEAYEEEMKKKKEERDFARKQQAKDTQNAIKEATIQITQQTIDSIFQIINTNRNNEFNLQIQRLNELKNRELSDKELTEEQKARIESRYQRQIAEIKTRQAQAEKRAALAQAAINGALAITKIISSIPGGPLNPATIASIAIAAATTAAQIAVISAQKIPKFAKGTEFVNGAGTSTSDSIPAMLSKGERVVDAKTNALLKGIPNKMLPMLPDLLAAHNINSNGMDYDKMAKSLSKELKNNPMLSVKLDKKGFETFLVSKNTTTIVKNNRHAI